MKPARVEVQAFPDSGRARINVRRCGTVSLLKLEVCSTTDGFNAIIGASRYHHDTFAAAVAACFEYASDYAGSLS